ncbi:MAG TPA: SDR family NAD(P)-dependent oxidoreductase [Nitrolancea sp.]|nr:SDR family NAD(P)-dependent oxidoreductase [Nitrolancea sp.]
MNVSFDFTGRVVIVTGAARGVGREMVMQFAATGASVVAADRDAEGLAETCRTIDPAKLESLVADVSTEDGAVAIVEAAVKRFGKLDVCVNNAAVAPHASLLEERVEVWDTVFAVNSRGTFLMTRAAARAMIDAGNGGRIINFSSGVTSRGSAGAAAYSASRAATEAFSRVAAVELSPHNILVNVVSPGLIDTQPKPLPPTMAASLGKRIPMIPLARPGEPSEVATLVLFLASDAAGYVTGSVYTIDGGSGIGTRPTGPVTDEDVRYDWVTGRQR